LVLDNVSCLFPGISEDKKQDWEPINAWLIRLRHRGITVLLGHHAGKGGQQRGTSGREDNLDTIIALTKPPGHQAKDGCHFHLRFEKARGIKGDTVDELDVRLDTTPDGLGWTWCPLDVKRKARIEDMLGDGMPPKSIAEELGISASYVYRRKRELSL
jgi:putative DNA primase/helicase